MPLKFVSGNDNVFQILGYVIPRPLTRAPPLDPARGLLSPDPIACAVLKFPQKFPCFVVIVLLDDSA